MSLYSVLYSVTTLLSKKINQISKSLMHPQKVKIYTTLNILGWQLIPKEKLKSVFKLGNRFWIVGISLSKSYIKGMLTYT